MIEVAEYIAKQLGHLTQPNVLLSTAIVAGSTWVGIGVRVWLGRVVRRLIASNKRMEESNIKLAEEVKALRTRIDQAHPLG